MTTLADIAPVISVALLAAVGLGVGCATTFDDFRHAARKPKAIGIGFASQYLFMPVSAYLLTLAFQLPTEIAIGVVLVGCSPGGTTSNLLTYFARGDVALSITMSFLSTCAAFALMPLWIWLLVKLAFGTSATVAWTEMVVSLCGLLVPTCIGLLIRRFNTNAKLCGKFLWKWVELVATVLGILLMIGTMAVAILAYGNLFSDMPAEAWGTAAIMQPLGCLFGFGLSKLLGISPKDQRTISLETGIQSFSLTIAVIQLSFQDKTVLHYALMFPVGYGLLYLAWSPLIVVFFRFYLAPKDPVDEKADIGDEGESERRQVGDEEDMRQSLLQ